MNGFDPNADNDMKMKFRLRWSQMEMRNLLGTRVKVTLVVLAKRLKAFFPCPRDLWNFELGEMI